MGGANKANVRCDHGNPLKETKFTSEAGAEKTFMMVLPQTVNDIWRGCGWVNSLTVFVSGKKLKDPIEDEEENEDEDERRGIGTFDLANGFS